MNLVRSLVTRSPYQSRLHFYIPIKGKLEIKNEKIENETFRMTVYALAQKIKYKQMDLVTHMKELLTENYQV